MSGTKPEIFVYLAVEEAEEVDVFMREIKEKFFDIVVNQNFLWSTRLWKYELFPTGFTS